MRENEKPIYTRLLSVLLAVSMLFDPVQTPSVFAKAGMAVEIPLEVFFPRDLKQIQIPSNIGKLEELYQGDERLVIVVQDAHAIPDAQRNIRNLIDFFQQSYGLDTVAVEGAMSELNPQIFRSFPDQPLLKNIFSDYLDKGELTGTAMAAIFNRKNAVYQGIEDWDLYEEGYGFYLESLKLRDSIETQIRERDESLNSRKESLYGAELLKVDQAIQDFHRNKLDLIKVLEVLAASKAPPPESEIALILKGQEESKESHIPVEIEVRSIAEKVREYFNRQSGGGNRESLAEFNEKFQAFQTSRISADQFALFLKELCRSLNLPLHFSSDLKTRVRQQRKMEDIEGTRFFDEFERYARSVKEALFVSQEERELDEETHRLYLLERLTRLELTREQWHELKSYARRGSFTGPNNIRLDGQDVHRFIPENDLRQNLMPHLLFYENAEARDEVFVRNLLALQKKQSAQSRSGTKKAVLIVAGGFHSEGVVSRLKEQGVSYLLLTPQIERLPEEITYGDQMRGIVSWKDYFEIEEGQVNVYNAFVRYTRDRLLAAVQTSEPLQGAFRAVDVLKTWRDQIIRDLADKGKVAESGKYTRFIDEADENSKTVLSSEDLNEKVKRFISGLRELEAAGKLNEQSIMHLVRPAGIQAPATGLILSEQPGRLEATDAVRKKILERIQAFARNELRQINEEDIDFTFDNFPDFDAVFPEAEIVEAIPIGVDAGFLVPGFNLVDTLGEGRSGIVYEAVNENNPSDAQAVKAAKGNFKLNNDWVSGLYTQRPGSRVAGYLPKVYQAYQNAGGVLQPLDLAADNFDPFSMPRIDVIRMEKVVSKTISEAVSAGIVTFAQVERMIDKLVRDLAFDQMRVVDLTNPVNFVIVEGPAGPRLMVIDLGAIGVNPGPVGADVVDRHREHLKELLRQNLTSIPEAETNFVPNTAPARSELRETTEAAQEESDTDELLRGLFERGTLRQYSAGEVIIRQGDPGRSFFLLLSGSVGVNVVKEEDSRSGIVGDIQGSMDGYVVFGEMAYFNGGLRSATIRAQDEVEVLELNYEDLKEIDPDGIFSEYLMNVQNERDAENRQFFEEGLDGRNSLKNTTAFANPAEALERLLSQMSEEEKDAQNNLASSHRRLDSALTEFYKLSVEKTSVSRQFPNGRPSSVDFIRRRALTTRFNELEKLIAEKGEQIKELRAAYEALSDLAPQLDANLALDIGAAAAYLAANPKNPALILDFKLFDPKTGEAYPLYVTYSPGESNSINIEIKNRGTGGEAALKLHYYPSRGQLLFSNQVAKLNGNLAGKGFYSQILYALTRTDVVRQIHTTVANDETRSVIDAYYRQPGRPVLPVPQSILQAFTPLGASRKGAGFVYDTVDNNAAYPELINYRILDPDSPIDNQPQVLVNLNRLITLATGLERQGMEILESETEGFEDLQNSAAEAAGILYELINEISAQTSEDEQWRYEADYRELRDVVLRQAQSQYERLVQIAEDPFDAFELYQGARSELRGSEEDFTPLISLADLQDIRDLKQEGRTLQSHLLSLHPAHEGTEITSYAKRITPRSAEAQQFSQTLASQGNNLVLLNLEIERSPGVTNFVTVLDTGSVLSRHLNDLLAGRRSDGRPLLNNFELLVSFTEYESQRAFHLRLISVGASDRTSLNARGFNTPHSQQLQRQGYGFQLFQKLRDALQLRLAVTGADAYEVSAIDDSPVTADGRRWTGRQISALFSPARRVRENSAEFARVNQRERVLEDNRENVWVGTVKAAANTPRSELRSQEILGEIIEFAERLTDFESQSAFDAASEGRAFLQIILEDTEIGLDERVDALNFLREVLELADESNLRFIDQAAGLDQARELIGSLNQSIQSAEAQRRAALADSAQNTVLQPVTAVEPPEEIQVFLDALLLEIREGAFARAARQMTDYLALLESGILFSPEQRLLAYQGLEDLIVELDAQDQASLNVELSLIDSRRSLDRILEELREAQAERSELRSEDSAEPAEAEDDDRWVDVESLRKGFPVIPNEISSFFNKSGIDQIIREAVQANPQSAVLAPQPIVLSDLPAGTLLEVIADLRRAYRYYLRIEEGGLISLWLDGPTYSERYGYQISSNEIVTMLHSLDEQTEIPLELREERIREAFSEGVLMVDRTAYFPYFYPAPSKQRSHFGSWPSLIRVLTPDGQLTQYVGVKTEYGDTSRAELRAADAQTVGKLLGGELGIAVGSIILNTIDSFFIENSAQRNELIKDSRVNISRLEGTEQVRGLFLSELEALRDAGKPIGLRALFASLKNREDGLDESGRVLLKALESLIPESIRSLPDEKSNIDIFETKLHVFFEYIVNDVFNYLGITRGLASEDPEVQRDACKVCPHSSAVVTNLLQNFVRADFGEDADVKVMLGGVGDRYQPRGPDHLWTEVTVQDKDENGNPAEKNFYVSLVDSQFEGFGFEQTAAGAIRGKVHIFSFQNDLERQAMLKKNNVPLFNIRVNDKHRFPGLKQLHKILSDLILAKAKGDEVFNVEDAENLEKRLRDDYAYYQFFTMMGSAVSYARSNNLEVKRQAIRQLQDAASYFDQYSASRGLSDKLDFSQVELVIVKAAMAQAGVRSSGAETSVVTTEIVKEIVAKFRRDANRATLTIPLQTLEQFEKIEKRIEQLNPDQEEQINQSLRLIEQAEQKVAAYLNEGQAQPLLDFINKDEDRMRVVYYVLIQGHGDHANAGTALEHLAQSLEVQFGRYASDLALRMQQNQNRPELRSEISEEIDSGNAQEGLGQSETLDFAVTTVYLALMGAVRNETLLREAVRAIQDSGINNVQARLERLAANARVAGLVQEAVRQAVEAKRADVRLQIQNIVQEYASRYAVFIPDEPVSAGLIIPDGVDARQQQSAARQLKEANIDHLVLAASRVDVKTFRDLFNIVRNVADNFFLRPSLVYDELAVAVLGETSTAEFAPAYRLLGLEGLSEVTDTQIRDYLVGEMVPDLTGLLAKILKANRNADRTEIEAALIRAVGIAREERVISGDRPNIFTFNARVLDLDLERQIIRIVAASA